MITLTDSDNGQLVDVAPASIAMVRIFDGTNTEVTMRWGEKVLVREGRHVVLHKMKAALFGVGECTSSLEGG